MSAQFHSIVLAAMVPGDSALARWITRQIFGNNYNLDQADQVERALGELVREGKVTVSGVFYSLKEVDQ